MPIVEVLAFALAIAALAALAHWRGELLRAIRETRALVERIAGPPEPDAGCEPDSPRLEEIAEENVPYLVLFAHVLYVSREAIEARAAEWRALFGGRADA